MNTVIAGSIVIVHRSMSIVMLNINVAICEKAHQTGDPLFINKNI